MTVYKCEVCKDLMNLDVCRLETEDAMILPFNCPFEEDNEPEWIEEKEVT